MTKEDKIRLLWAEIHAARNSSVGVMIRECLKSEIDYYKGALVDCLDKDEILRLQGAAQTLMHFLEIIEFGEQGAGSPSDTPPNPNLIL